jgi:phosphatidylglycerol:prolipoprotein diacylglycerol transferase
VRFPLEALNDRDYPGLGQTIADQVAAARGIEAAAPDRLAQSMLSLLREGDSPLRDSLNAALPPRHPSQLYEALLEGLLLFAILFFIRWRWARLPHGLLTGLFFILYALFRILGEHWRVPDATGLAWLHPLTPGQQFSLPMLAIGAGFLWSAWRRRPSHDRGQKSVAPP